MHPCGSDYVKTSTGFEFVKGEDGKYSYQGATLENLKLMKASIGPGVKLKAAGGVRTLDQLIAVKGCGVFKMRCHRHGGHAGRGHA